MPTTITLNQTNEVAELGLAIHYQDNPATSPERCAHVRIQHACSSLVDVPSLYSAGAHM
jgi:hypothetical protein